MNKTINQGNLNASLRFLDKQGEAILEQLKTTDPAQAERLEKLGKLLSNEAFCKQFVACTEKQAAVKLFDDNGFAVTEGDVEALMAQIKAIAQKLLDNNGELSEEDLEQIAGGGASTGLVVGVSVGSAVVGAGIGTMICPGIGSAVGAVLGALLGALGLTL